MRAARPLLVSLALVTALAAPARAGNDVGVVVTGETWMHTQLVAQLEGWLIQHGHTVVPSPLPPEASKLLDDCLATADPAGCVRGVLDQGARTSELLYARIDARGGGDAPEVTLTAYWFTRGNMPVSLRRGCARCTEQSLRTAADDLLKRLIGGELGHVVLKSAPPGATITIDGTPIGVAPLDWDLPAGKHAIQMDKPGRLAASRDVTVVANRSTLVVLTLPVAGGDEPAETSLRPLPLGLMIGGGALVVTGAILIAVDQDPSAMPSRRYYRDTAPLGYGLAAGGIVAGAAGAYLMWFRSPSPGGSPVAAFTGDHGYIGWLGRF